MRVIDLLIENRNSMKKNSLLLILIVVHLLAFSQGDKKHIRHGVEIYKEAQSDTSKVDTLTYSKAEVAFRKALEEDLDSYEASFNLADALFKQEKFEDAGNQFKVLAHKEDDKTKLGEIYYNLGNSLLASGKLEDGIEAYKNSLRNNPNDTTAKYNLAVAQKMLKEQENQQCENPDQNQENQDKENQDKEQQQEKQDQQKQEEKNQEQKEQKEQEQKQAKEEENKDQQKKDQISKEDALRLLQALENDEKDVQEKLKKEKAKAKKIRIEKDW